MVVPIKNRNYSATRSDQCSILNSRCSSDETQTSDFVPLLSPRMRIEHWELSIGQIYLLSPESTMSQVCYYPSTRENFQNI